MSALVNYELHCEIHGPNHCRRIEDHLIEEMAELTQKILQRRRGRDVDRFSLVEEMVDVNICLQYLKKDNNVGDGEWASINGVKNIKMKQQLEAIRDGQRPV